MPTELSTTNKAPWTNEKVQGNLLHDYERKFAGLPDHLQLIKLCTNVGIVKIVATQECSSSYFQYRCIATENMCSFVHAVVCCCGCFGVTRLRETAFPCRAALWRQGLWRCGTVPASCRSFRGNVVVPSQFFRVGERHPFLSLSVRGNHPSKKPSALQARTRAFQSFCMRSSS